MSDLSFRIKSSDGTGVYTVTASREDGVLRITCDCPAGIYGTHCRHRFELVGGENKYCLDPSPDDIRALNAMVEATPLRGLAAEITALSRDADAIKRRLASLKKSAARIMTTGK